MDNTVVLTFNELKEIKPGEAISVAAVMAILVTAIVAVIVYRIFMSSSGEATIPGGFKFEWK
jgi:hypothetical protein